MYANLYKKIASSAQKDTFQGGTSGAGAVIAATLTVILLVILQLFIVQWLWNNVLTRVTTIAKPIPSLLHALGLLILVAMVHPGYAAVSA
jgi:hypothetical protein